MPWVVSGMDTKLFRILVYIPKVQMPALAMSQVQVYSNLLVD